MDSMTFRIFVFSVTGYNVSALKKKKKAGG